MGRATSGVTGMKFRDGDSVLSMSVIRAEQVAAEELASEQRRSTSSRSPTAASPSASRISEYRLTNRGDLASRRWPWPTRSAACWSAAFIVEEGDEILSITQNGQVVRSPINADFRPTGRSTMGVKFVTPKAGDAVAVVARSVEAG